MISHLKVLWRQQSAARRSIITCDKFTTFAKCRKTIRSDFRLPSIRSPHHPAIAPPRALSLYIVSIWERERETYTIWRAVGHSQSPLPQSPEAWPVKTSRDNLLSPASHALCLFTRVFFLGGGRIPDKRKMFWYNNWTFIVVMIGLRWAR